MNEAVWKGGGYACGLALPWWWMLSLYSVLGGREQLNWSFLELLAGHAEPKQLKYIIHFLTENKMNIGQTNNPI